MLGRTIAVTTRGDGMPRIAKIQIRSSPSLARWARCVLVLAGLGLTPAVATAAPGDPDPSFGSAGIVLTTLDRNSVIADAAVNALVQQSDGKLVAAGYNLTEDNTIGSLPVKKAIALARYNLNGSLDATFGSAGIVLTTLDHLYSGAALFLGDVSANALVEQSDGKLVVAGAALVFDPLVGRYQSTFALARYNADGSPDLTFGKGGAVVTPKLSSSTTFEDASANSLVQQSDGKLVVAGGAHAGSASPVVVARYNPDGSLDASFGSGESALPGVVFFYQTEGDTIFNPVANALVQQSDGKLLVAGQGLANHLPSGQSFLLIRYNPDGSLDPTFGIGGSVGTITVGSNDAYGNALVQQNGGKLVIAGTVFSQLNLTAQLNSTAFIKLNRYNADGSSDNTFGVRGAVGTRHRRDAEATALVQQSDGKLVAAGGASEPSFFGFALARYSPNGSRDKAFGRRGLVVTRVGETPATASALLQQSDGKLVAAGGANYNSVFALVRYLAE
jgi:uncharacterized delta-60 repeat protein